MTKKKDVSYKTYSYKLAPTDEQLSLLKQFGGASRFVYNHFLNINQQKFKNNEKILSFSQQCKLLTELKNNPEYDWMKSIHSQVLQQSLKNLEDAYHRFFEMLKTDTLPKKEGQNYIRKDGFLAGSPNYKRKNNHQDSFRYPQGFKVDNENKQVFLPKIGWISFHGSRPMKGTPKSITVKQNIKGFTIRIMCEVLPYPQPIPVEELNELNTIGVDMGVKNLVVASDGYTAFPLRKYRRSEKKIQREQKKLSRKQLRSENYKKQQKILAKVHLKVKNQRQDALHKIALDLLRDNQAVVIEDLNAKGMMQNHKLAKSVQDASFGMFKSILITKAKMLGKHVLIIDRYFPSSQLCSCCGYQNKNLTMKDREWQCPECNTIHDRDWNASFNILDEGLKALVSLNSKDSPVAVGHTEVDRENTALRSAKNAYGEMALASSLK